MYVSLTLIIEEIVQLLIDCRKGLLQVNFIVFFFVPNLKKVVNFLRPL
jgi:hypothetical protein